MLRPGEKAGTLVRFVSARIDFQNLSQFYCTLFLAWLSEIWPERKIFSDFPTLPIDIVGIMVYS